MTPSRFQWTRRRLAAVTGLILFAGWSLTACSDDDTASADTDRPQVTFTADDTSISAPAEVPSGLVDITLDTAPGDVGHHIFVAQMHDGVTVDEILNGDDDAFFTKLTIRGGNGTIAAGKQALMTLDLEPGNYFVLDNPQNEFSPTDEFRVVEGEESRVKPDAKGTIHMGPGMVIDVPDDFDGRGTWEFVNQDTAEVHEAAMVKLAAGASAHDLVEWFTGDMAAPPPIDGEFGSIGALGPGQRAWMTVEPGEPGDYVVVCFIPGRDGIPHLAKGMVTEFTIDG